MRAESIRTTTELLQQADAVLVGAGSGLSSAAGYNHYHHNTVFEENFHDFEKAYGIQSLFQGFYYVYSKPEQQWGFYSRYIRFMEEAPVGQPYIDLLEILREKEYFILTTNCDIQIPKVFPEDRICQFQGDFRYFQCSQPCHDKLYESHDLVSAMLDNMEGLEVPAEWIPRCPECGGPMKIHMIGPNFIQPTAEKERLDTFLKKYQGKNLVILELGIGWRNQLIKAPLMRLTAQEPNAAYITINLGEVYITEDIKEKSFGVNGYLDETLAALKKEAESLVSAV